MRSLKARLERLEGRRATAPDGLPPAFWGVLWGTTPSAELDPETERLVAWLMEPTDRSDDDEALIARYLTRSKNDDR